MKRRRSILNIISGIISKLVIALFGLILPRFFITTYGSEINGLVTSISNIFAYVNLLEAGIATASIQALYKPLVQGEYRKINGILSATTAYYKKIGFYVLGCIIILACSYPFLVKTEIDTATIIGVIILTGSITLIDYFFQAKYRVLLMAESKRYILNNIGLLVNILSNVTKIILIYMGFNIIIIQLSFVLINALKVFIVQIYIRSSYKYLNTLEEPDFDSISNRKYTTVRHVAYIIFKNIDILVLTIFCDLKTVSVYSIYKLIYNGVNILPDTIFTGVNSSFGQLYAENRIRFKRLYNCFEVYYTALLFLLYTVSYTMITPFLKLYTSGVTDINYVIKYLPLLYTVSELLDYMRKLSENVAIYAGHFKQTQLPALIELILNIVLSIVFVNIWGITGVLLSTIISIIYRLIMLTLYTNKTIYKRNIFIPIFRWFFNGSLAILCSIIISYFGITINSYFSFVKYVLFYSIIMTVIFFVCNSLFEHEARKVLITYFNSLKTKFLGRKYEVENEYK